MRPTRRLRELLNQPGVVRSLGAHDVFTARLIEAAGLETVFVGGFGTAASLLGLPDVGLLTLTEMADAVRRMAGRVAIPVVADGDTGHGDLHNVVRTVREFEAAGAAGVLLEDQVTPKRCGHFAGKQVIPAADMLLKLRAALDARRDPDFALIARTDARAVEGMDSAIERARRYREAGADVLFVEAAESEDEISAVARALHDVPLLFNWAEGGKTPPVDYATLAALGFKVVIFPIATLLGTTAWIRHALAEIRKAGTPLPIMDELPRFGEFLDFIGLPEIRDLEQRFPS